MPTDSQPLEELDASLALGTAATRAFTARLHQANFDWPHKDLQVHSQFFHLALRDGIPTTDDFLEYVSHQIVPFCIPYEERQQARQQLADSGDWSHVSALYQKARDLFIKHKQSRKSTGEPGELILFLILECALNAPQIACKMYLKTAQNMPVHGADSIHVGHDTDYNRLLLYWGESKLYKSLSNAIHAIVASLETFAGTGGVTSSSKARDIAIVRDHVSLPTNNPALTEEVLSYLDPYSEKSNQRRDVYACLACFDMALYHKLRDLPDDEAEQLFVERYNKRIEAACNTFAEDLRKSSIKHLRFCFFLLPFESVTDFRDRFLQKIGI